MAVRKRHIKVQLYHPMDYQRAVLDGLYANWSDSFHFVKAVRQCGKSMMLENLLIRVSLANPNQTSVLISPTFKQGKKIFKSIAKKFRRTPLYASSNSSDLEYTFINGSTIVFLSAEQGDNIRGQTVTQYGVLAIDEAAYISDEVFYTATPFVNANHAPIVAVSTPRFKQGFFYEFYNDGLNGRQNVHSYDFTDYDNPFLTADKLELYRTKMPLNLFRADYLGEWMETTSDVFGDFQKVLNNSVTMTGEYTAGIDWGVGKNAKNNDSDSTSLSIFNDLYQQVGIIHWNDLDETTTIARIVDALKTWNVKKVVVETNSIGGVYLGLLRKAILQAGLMCQVVEFNTSNESKREIIENFIVHVQNRTIQLLNDNEQSIQMSAFRMEKTPSGKITYNGTPGYHDDCIMATAFALHGMKVGMYNIL